jgi:hypothetical protein
LDTVIALRRPEDYSPEQGARFEVHLEKLRNRVDGDGAIPFEPSVMADREEGVRWSSRDLTPPILKRATELFADGLTVREVATILRVSKSEAGRLRLRAVEEGLLVPEHNPELNGQEISPSIEPKSFTARPATSVAKSDRQKPFPASSHCPEGYVSHGWDSR